MFGTQHLTLFIISGLLLNLTPGQDTLYIVSRSVSQGRRAGFLSVLGIVVGCVIHTIAAAFGLSALLATSAHAFTGVKIAGAAYLSYLGIRMIASFLFLGAVFIVNGTVWCFVRVWGASAMSRRLRHRGSFGVLLKRATGALFVGLGLRLAVSK